MKHSRDGDETSVQQIEASSDTLCYLDAVDLAARIRRKDVSARDVMSAHLAQIERINPKVNAIVTLVAERAMADAARADETQARGGPLGVLHGLPVAHKDLVDTAGIRTTRGSPFYRDNVPTSDALIITLIRAAGAVTLGQDQHSGIGRRVADVQHDFWRDAQSVRRHEDVRREQWRRRGGARVRDGADRRRQRYWAVRCAIRRRSATSSACAPRRVACRGSRRRGRRFRSQVRWRVRWLMWRCSSARSPRPIDAVRW